MLVAEAARSGRSSSSQKTVISLVRSGAAGCEVIEVDAPSKRKASSVVPGR